MRNFSDEELINEIRDAQISRRQKAFDCLYSRYALPLTDYFYFTLDRDREQAKDFVHDLFIKLLESPEKFNPELQFKPWIFRVADNMCKNEFRKQRVVRKYRDHVETTARKDAVIPAKDKNLRQCIARLNHDKRSLIILRFRLELSIREIAEISECPEGTVKSRLYYAIRELSDYYKE